VNNATNNTGSDPTPVSSFSASLASSQSLLSLSDPLNCFIADLPFDMFQPVHPATYSASNVQGQPSAMQPQQQGGSMQQPAGTFPTYLTMTRDTDERNQSMISGITPMTIDNSASNPISDEAVAQIVSNSSVPEFLYQLTKMLTDDHRDIIEWSNAKIEVHNPHRLESEVLNKYFRHSKYASFQRQLNYFGFRKLAGKGKMAPCSYVNENATTDLRSILRMKRKTSANATKETKDEKIDSGKTNDRKSSTSPLSSTAIPTVSVGVKRSRDPSNSYVSVGPVAKIAVGKGVKHRLNGYLKNTPEVNTRGPVPSRNQLEISVDPQVIAKAAVGKGISHQFSVHNHSSPLSVLNRTSTNVTKPVISGTDPTSKYQGNSSNNFTFLDPSQLGMDIESSLSELQNNYQNSLNESVSCTDYNDDYFSKSGLRRESSLVALAMIPSLGSIEPTSVSEMQRGVDSIDAHNSVDDTDDEKNMINFIDFPGDDNMI